MEGLGSGREGISTLNGKDSEERVSLSSEYFTGISTLNGPAHDATPAAHVTSGRTSLIMLPNGRFEKSRSHEKDYFDMATYSRFK